jgi:hypothetical protein
MKDVDLEEFMDNREKRIAFAFMAIEARKSCFRHFRRKTPLKGKFFFILFVVAFFLALLWLAAK